MNKIGSDMKKFTEAEIMESLSGMSRAELPPYFYTRVLAKWKASEPEKLVGKWIPALACALLMLLLISNLRLISISNTESKNNLSDTEQFSQTYYLQSNQTIYEIDMEQ